MKIPKKTNRYCPYCNKKTEQKISLLSTGTKRGTLKRGSLERAKWRNAMTGVGNQGKRSRKAIKSWKRKSKTTTRKVRIYTCIVCKKSAHAKNSLRVSKLLVGEK